MRIAGSIVVVWMLTILWSLRGNIGAEAKDELRAEVHDFTPSRQRDLQQPPQRSGPATQPDDLAPDLKTDDPDTDVAYDWSAEAKGYAGLMLALGWAPGLVYAGLLLLARKATEPPTVEVVGEPGRDDGRGPHQW